MGVGGTLTFTVANGGTGYVQPQINIPQPSYENLEVVGVSRLGVGATTETGKNLLITVDVGPTSTVGIGSTLREVKSFKISLDKDMVSERVMYSNQLDLLLIVD